MSGVTAGECPFMAGFANEVGRSRRFAAVVLATTCDQMRRAAEIPGLGGNESRPVFVFNVPSTWQSGVAKELYASELLRLGDFLQRAGGRRPGKRCLRDTMLDFQDRRTAVEMLCAGLPARAAAEVMAVFHETGRVVKTRGLGRRAVAGGVPVALLGGPLARRDFAILDAVEACGGRVVMDGTENGGRTFPTRFDRRRVATDPSGAMVAAYFDAMAEVFRRPNTQFYDWLSRKTSESGARGIVLIRYLWCDLWHVESQRIRDAVNIPVLQIDLGGGAPTSGVATRIQAFIESLTGRDGAASSRPGRREQRSR